MWYVIGKRGTHEREEWRERRVERLKTCWLIEKERGGEPWRENSAQGCSQEITRVEEVKGWLCIFPALPHHIPFVLIAARGHTPGHLQWLLDVYKSALCNVQYVCLLMWSQLQHSMKALPSPLKTTQQRKWLTSHCEHAYSMCFNAWLLPVFFLLAYLLIEQGGGQFLDFRSQQLGPSDDFAQCSQGLVDALWQHLQFSWHTVPIFRAVVPGVWFDIVPFNCC